MLMIQQQTATKTCAFVTLGCKVNQYDTQAIREGLQAAGYAEVAPEASADVYVVNTCTVTGQSGAKSRQAIRRFQRRNPGARVVVTGCYAESDRDALEAMGGIDVIASNADKFTIPALLDPDAEMARYSGLGEIRAFQGHARAFMKVEDGCDLNCTFCIIPAVRGAVRSKSVAEATAEAGRLVASGHKEIVLTGIHLGAYGQDFDGEGLPQLIAALDRINGLERIRLSSIEANEVTGELLEVIAGSQKVCPHFHLPLQAGDDAVLKRMRRQYTVKMYGETVERIRNRLDRPTFTTDAIVGFPGETESQFENTVELCRATGFIKIHVFPYSVRSGTPAARMTNFVTPEEIESRSQRLLATSDELGLAHRKCLIGRELEVLVEGGAAAQSSGEYSGLTRRYERVALDKGTPEMDNTVFRVRVHGAEPQVLFGSVS